MGCPKLPPPRNKWEEVSEIIGGITFFLVIIAVVVMIVLSLL